MSAGSTSKKRKFVADGTLVAKKGRAFSWVQLESCRKLDLHGFGWQIHQAA